MRIGPYASPAMLVARSPEALAPHHRGVFVPTMGALHEGHAALIRYAKSIAEGSPVVVSIFVNPTQFNDPRDFARYPRTLDADLAVCDASGAGIVFVPSVETMYPSGTDASGDPRPLPAPATEPGLEDAHRPGHFAGVCRVCRRLFELVRPAKAVFGEKDWQQLAVIRAMVAGERLPLEIVGRPTIREPDGLAMSSRNALLTLPARRHAVGVSRAMIEAGRCADPPEAEGAGRRVLLANRLRPEYVAVRDAATLGPIRADSPARVLVAAKCGDVRLIDNAPWPGFTL